MARMTETAAIEGKKILTARLGSAFWTLLNTLLGCAPPPEVISGPTTAA
jgi:hypothetical protein